MKLNLFRHATMLLTLGERKILLDPMLALAETMPPVENSPLPRANPLVEFPKRAMLDEAEAILITHCHRDHFDQAAIDELPKTLPVFCQPEDERRLLESGFSQVTPLFDEAQWNGIRLSRTGGRHGYGATANAMGPVSGYVLEAQGEAKLYITGDTVWCQEVEAALLKHKPEIIIAYCGGARFLNDKPITMDENDIRALLKASKADVIAVHMEAFNHCLLTRQALRSLIPDARLKIPLDGEELIF